MEYREIEYKDVKDKIVEQAYESAFSLTEEQTRKLIQDKFERAKAMYDAIQASPEWHTDR